MKIIRLDASGWSQVPDFCAALFAALQAPAWHGMSIDALIDSMIYGDINAVEPPYRIEIENAASMPHELQEFVALAAWHLAMMTPLEAGEPQVSIVPARG